MNPKLLTAGVVAILVGSALFLVSEPKDTEYFGGTTEVSPATYNPDPSKREKFQAIDPPWNPELAALRERDNFSR